MKNLINCCCLFIGLLLLNSCEQDKTSTDTVTVEETAVPTSKVGLDKYTSVKLTTDISQLSDKESKCYLY